MAHGQFAKLFDDNKLKGPNYADWYRNLNLVLTSEKLDKVAKNLALEHLGDRASEARRREYLELEEKNSLARCYVVASLDNSVQRQFDKIKIYKDILDSLMMMYKEENCSTKQKRVEELIKKDKLVAMLVESGKSDKRKRKRKRKGKKKPQQKAGNLKK
ncbi:PREDICTED: uncharacterized protein LOC109114177 [Nelumbo nucifera]|uniref:Uncharacterized protein LOC109114177 n=1 Tax=Nelumbo nucifera TaxID=4432 RepID=A0A1U8PZI9_NELNU|nr:PREDICTED: uncharacterized protein LOC109114177 [Nelumbo nucifera]